MKSYVLIEKFKSKKCTTCGYLYPATSTFFQKLKHRNNKLKNECKKCHNTKIKEWLELNKEDRKVYYKQYCKDKKDEINKVKREYKSNRKKVDDLYKSTISIRNLISSSLKKRNFSKESRTYEILGCTFNEFKTHIESQFLPWMVWDNYGLYNGELNFGWDFDHITPLDSAKTYNDVIILNHYTNFQPLCSKVNRDIKR